MVEPVAPIVDRDQEPRFELAGNTRGEVMLAWGGHDTVITQLFDSRGRPQTEPVLVHRDMVAAGLCPSNTSSCDFDAHPALAAGPDGDFVLLWVTGYHSGHHGGTTAYSRRFDVETRSWGEIVSLGSVQGATEVDNPRVARSASRASWW
ncbi:MAG: hypothetical protein HC897_02955 [Thermoanaerobaculia bacterium]|nr:hypothetical protein [Thermoanaerobaculia bacterium]